MYDIYLEDYSVRQPGRLSSVICHVPKLKFSAGRTFGITGQSGQGKTLFLRSIAGLVKHEGLIRFLP